MYKFFLLLLAMLISGCATVQTVDAQLNNVSIRSEGSKSHCEKLPRVYSGLGYHFCMFYGEPNNNVDADDSKFWIQLHLLDAVLSAAADTVVLPYTIYLQNEKGSMTVN